MTLDTTAHRPSGLRERNKLDKLRRIKDAARALFIAKGFDDTTTREIALRAGVGLGTIFVYAENKRDLLFLIINEHLEKVTQNADESIDPPASLIDNLMTVAKLHYQFFGEQPALSRFALREMIFYDPGAPASPSQTTRPRRIGQGAKRHLLTGKPPVYRVDDLLHISSRVASLARLGSFRSSCRTAVA